MLKLREFIKKIRACKTSEEERSLINKETADIRNLSKEQAEEFKLRSLSKCVFISILGYHTEFIQMTCINLLASSSFLHKRLAYLALSTLMDENSELLLLTSNTIKNDIDNSNPYISACALRAIGEICSSDMCRDAAPNVIKCLSNSNPYIQKKACLALTKIIERCPELVDSVSENLNLIFEYENNGLMISGLQLIINVFKIEKSYIESNKKYIPKLIKILKDLSNCSTIYGAEYDFEGTLDPFLQVKIIEVLSYLCKDMNNDKLNNLLASITTNTNSNKNPGNAVLYEVVKTIFFINGNDDIKELAVNILTKFMNSDDINYRFIALNLLTEIAKTDIKFAQKNKTLIFNCLKDNDILIKRRSLNLIYMIVDNSMLKQFIKECLNFLITGEEEFKFELTVNITQTLKRYCPSLKWEINILIRMLCLAGNFTNESTINSITNLIIKTEVLHKYSMMKLIIAMKSNFGQEGLIKVGLYCIGELIDVIIGVSVKTDIEEYNINEEEIKNIIEEIRKRKISNDIKKIMVNMYFKILQKDNLSVSFKQYIYELLEQETHSYNYEIQERAIEYIIFYKSASEKIKNEMKKSIPINKTETSNILLQKNIIQEDYDDEDDPIYIQLVDPSYIITQSQHTEPKLTLVDNIIDNTTKPHNDLLSFEETNSNLLNL